MNSTRTTLYLLCLGEIIERFAYFGLFTILVLKFHLIFHFTDNKAFTIFGAFTALSYTSLVLGGYITDKWLAPYKALLIGGCLLLSGSILLASNVLNFFYAGLSFVIVGTAFFKVNCTTLVGKLYQDDPLKKERSFTLFYSAMNLGGLLGALSYGFIIEFLGWSTCFYINAILFLIIILVFTFHRSLKIYNQSPSHLTKALLSITVFLGLLWLCFYSTKIVYIFLSILWISIILCLSKFTFTQVRSVKNNMLILLLLNIGCVFFFACSLQVGSSITLFIQRDIHRHIGNLILPTPSFSALDPLFVIIMAPVFVLLWKVLAKRNCTPFITTKIAIGLLLAALGFLTLHITTSITHFQLASISGIVIANLFLGAGEICITPSALSAINKYSPAHLQSTMIGVWFLFIAFAGFLASQLAMLADAPKVINSSAISANIYNYAFLDVMLFALGAAFFVYLCKYLLKRLS